MTETMPEHLSWILWTQQEDLLLHFFFSGSDLGKLAKPAYQMALERILGIRELRVSHSSVW
jgi:hypothetical protein